MYMERQDAAWRLVHSANACMSEPAVSREGITEYQHEWARRTWERRLPTRRPDKERPDAAMLWPVGPDGGFGVELVLRYLRERRGTYIVSNTRFRRDTASRRG